MNRWTVLTVVLLIALVCGVWVVLTDFTLWNVSGFAVQALITYWIVGGCARRGEPVARRLTPWL